jgi:polysaccharide biosynthesis protein PslH
MNILFITPSLPDRLKRVRAFCLIKALSQQHKVHLLSLSTGTAGASFDEIKSLCVSITIVKKSFLKSFLDCTLAIPTVTPFEVAYCKSGEMEKAVVDLIKKHNIDLVYVKRLRAAQFAENVSIKKVLDTTDAMSLFYEKLSKKTRGIKKIFDLIEGERYARYENYLAKKYHNWVTCSQVDKEYLVSQITGASISVIPNVVDTTYHIPNSIPEKHSIMVSGLMDKTVNIEAALFLALEIFPLVSKKIPDAKLYIVGPNPLSSIKNLASKNIIVTGFVKDIRKYIDASSVVACPVLTGTGTRNKILQAWAHRKPIVTTTEGLKGLQGENNRDCLVADTKEDFAAALIEVLNNKGKAEAIAQNGYDLVQKNFSIDSIIEALESYLPNV